MLLRELSECIQHITVYQAEIARIDGIVDRGKNVRGRQTIIIRDPDNKDVFEEHNIPTSKHLIVGKGDYVRKGQKLTVGSIIPQKLLEICGPHELQRYIVNDTSCSATS